MREEQATATHRAVTWWGHSSMSVELGDRVVAADPLLTTRLYHLRRSPPAPPPEAARADVVLVSHLHHDHLHLPSLARFGRDVPVVCPRGAHQVVPGLDRHPLLEVVPGDEVEVAGVRVQVLDARHDGRRSNLSRSRVDVPAVGFRVERGEASLWYPGDTGPADFSEIGAVDLAAVPIGGWGPSLGDEHLDPTQAAAAVGEVGARWSLAVHYGTFWPITLRRLQPHNHQHLFVTPPARFHQAVRNLGIDTLPLTPPYAERLVLSPR